MKKLLKRSGALLIVFAMLLSMTCISAFAADPPTISVSLADGSEAVDVTAGAVTVTLAINIANNPGVASVQGTLILPEGWSFDGVDANGFIQPQLFYMGPPIAVSIMLDSGSVSLNANTGSFGALSGSEDATDDGYVMWVPVTIPAETVTGEYEIGLTLTEVTQSNPEATGDVSSALLNITSSFTAVGCTVSVTGTAAVDPNPVDPDPDPEPVPATGGTITVGDVSLNAEDGSVLLPVNITDNPGFASMMLTITIPDGLTAVSVKRYAGIEFSIPLIAGMQFDSNLDADSTDPAAGQTVIVSMAGASDATGDGVLFWLEIAPDTNAANVDYAIGIELNEAFSAVDLNEDVKATYTTSGGTVRVSGLLESGTVTAGSAKFELTGTDKSVLIPVSITDNPGFAAMNLTVSVPEGWTTSKVYFVNDTDVAITTGVLNSYKINANTNSDVVISFANATNITGDGVLAWIEYVPGSGAAEGSYPITVTVNEAYSADDLNTNVASAYKTVDGALNVTELKGGTVTAGSALFELTGTDKSVLIPVSITGNPGFAAMKLTVSVPEGWTTSKVYFTNDADVAITAGILNSYKIDANTNSDVVITFANAANVTGDGVLAWIEYVPGSNAAEGSYPITVTVDEAYSADNLNTNAAYVYETVDGALNVTEVKGGTVTAGSASFELTGTDKSVLIPVSIADNPGFAAMKLTVSVPEGWTTSKVYFVNSTELAVTAGVLNSYKIDANSNSDVVITFANATNVTGDGVLAWIEYVPGSGAAEGSYPITVTVDEAYSADDLNTNANYVYKTVDGALNVTEVKGGTVTAGTAALNLSGNDSVRVPVSITGNPGFAAMKLTVSVPEGWTTSKVYFVNDTELAITAGILNSYKIDANSNSDVVITFANATNVTGDGVLAWIEYVPGDSVKSGEYPISVTVEEAYSANDLNTNAAYVYQTADGAILTSFYTISIADGIDGTADVHEGDEVVMYVTVSGADFNGAKATVAYDSELFTYVSCDEAESEDVSVQADADAGQITLRRLSDKLLPDGTAVATLRFTANEVDETATGDFEITAGTADVFIRAASTDAQDAATFGDSVRIVKQFTVTFLDQDGETVLGTYLVDDGAKVTAVPDAPDVDYHTFDKWYIGETGYTADEILALEVTADVTYQAVYTVNSYDVDLSEGLTGADTVTYGEDYTGTITGYDGDNYSYTVTYTVGEDGEEKTAQVNSDGTFTIPGNEITGALSVTVTATANSYDVELSDGLTGETTATYGEDYTGTITGYDGDNYSYTVTYTVGEDGEEKTAQVNSDGTFTISGNEITGALSVTVTATANSYDVDLSEGLTGADTVTYGEDYIGTINGYDSFRNSYTVTYTIGGVEKTAQVNADGTFTIPGNEITGAVSITLTTVAKDFNVEVYADYVTGYTLVTVTNLTGNDSAVFNYDGNAMYYVEAYSAYAWIVEGDLTVEDAEALVTMGTGASAGTIAAGYDVNDTDLVDFNDTLVAFGCYKVVEEFPLVVEGSPAVENIALYLRADVNSDYVVNATDINLVDSQSN